MAEGSAAGPPLRHGAVPAATVELGAAVSVARESRRTERARGRQAKFMSPRSRHLAAERGQSRSRAPRIVPRTVAITGASNGGRQSRQQEDHRTSIPQQVRHGWQQRRRAGSPLGRVYNDVWTRARGATAGTTERAKRRGRESAVGRLAGSSAWQVHGRAHVGGGWRGTEGPHYAESWQHEVWHRVHV